MVTGPENPLIHLENELINIFSNGMALTEEELEKGIGIAASQLLVRTDPYEAIQLVDRISQDMKDLGSTARKKASEAAYKSIFDYLVGDQDITTEFNTILDHLIALDHEGKISTEGFVYTVGVLKGMEEASKR